jgi:hypothetical protein
MGIVGCLSATDVADEKDSRLGSWDGERPITKARNQREPDPGCTGELDTRIYVHYKYRRYPGARTPPFPFPTWNGHQTFLLPSLCAVGLIDANRAEGRGNCSLCMVLCQAFLGDQTVPLRVDNRRGLYEVAMQKRAGTG